MDAEAITAQAQIAIDDKIEEVNARPRKIGGLYLNCFHGRYTIDENLDDWGFQGPYIGPLKWVHTTYASDVKLAFENPEDAKAFGMDPDFTQLLYIDGLLRVMNAYYGDVSAYIETGE